MNRIPTCIDSFPEITLPAQQQVFSQGQACQHYIVLTSGHVKVFARSDDGRELVLYRIQPGEVCILTTACLMGNSHYSAEAITESDITARVIPQRDFNKLLTTSEAFREFVFHNFSQRMTELMQQLEQITFDSIERRLSHFIYRMSENSHQLALTHQAIATEIGSAREVVSRSLKKLESQGVIKLNRGTIDIIDRPALRKGPLV